MHIHCQILYKGVVVRQWLHQYHNKYFLEWLNAKKKTKKHFLFYQGADQLKANFLVKLAIELSSTNLPAPTGETQSELCNRKLAVDCYACQLDYSSQSQHLICLAFLEASGAIWFPLQPKITSSINIVICS